VKTAPGKRNKRRSQRFRAATGLKGTEWVSGAAIQIRDFSSESIAVESTIQVTVGKPVVLELPMADQTFSLHGIVVRTDRLPAVGTGPNYLLVVELAWHTVPERLQIAGFLSAIRRSNRTA
jgi:hypothetical protein